MALVPAAATVGLASALIQAQNYLKGNKELVEGSKEYLRQQYQRGREVQDKRQFTMGRRSKIANMAFGPETKGGGNMSAQKQMVARGINGPVRSPTATFAYASKSKGSRAKGIPGSDGGVTMFFRAETELVNTNTGGLDGGNTLLLGTNPSVYYIGNTWCSQLGTLSGIYREFRIKKMRFSYVPRNAYTTVGSVAIGIDDDPRASVPATGTAGFGKTNIAQVSKLPNYLLTDIKEPGQFVYIPKGAEGQRWRYTKDTGGRPLEFTAHGVVLFASNNNIADTTTSLGLLYIETWIEFKSPY